jgi:two-component system NarL family response regulator
MKLLLADDHPLFLDGLRNLLTSHGFEVLGMARNGLEALEMARALRPEVILMDIQMPQLDGLAAMCLIQAEMPEIKIVMLTMSAEDEHLFEAIKNGASGYLLKTQDTGEFFALLEDVARGEVALSPGLATRILHEFGRKPATGEAGSTSLSKREMQVLTLVAQGLTYKEVGARLFVSERTIKYHMGEIVSRLQMGNRDQVIEYARRSGLIGGASAFQGRFRKE